MDPTDIDTGIWSDFAEEGLAEMEAQAEIQMDLEADAKEGR